MKQVINNTDINPDTAKAAFNKVNDNFTELYQRVIYPEDYSAVGNGTSDDVTPLTNYFLQLSSGTNKFQGSSLKTIYQTSGSHVINSVPYIKFIGLIRRTTASVATTLVDAALSSDGFVDIDLNLDGNAANSNLCTGYTITSGSANVKSRHTISARNFELGILMTGNVEKLTVDAFCKSCNVAVEVTNDGSSATVDESEIKITGDGCNTIFKATGTEKISGQVYINFEGSGDESAYSVIQENGAWSYRGQMRGRDGGFYFGTNAALFASIDMFMFAAGTDAPLAALLCDAPNLDLTGRMVLIDDWVAGVWIQRVNSCNLKIIKTDSDSTAPIGIRIGDSANAKTVNGIVLEEGTTMFGTVGLDLDSSVSGSFYLTQNINNGSIRIRSGSSKNRIIIPHNIRAVTITNERIQNDNSIFYKGIYTNAELEQINGGTFFKGMVVEASADAAIYGPIIWNGSNWHNPVTGLTYNTGTNTWS